MCKAIVSTLEGAMGDQWTPETARAWAKLWESAAATMSTAIDEAEQHGSAMEDLWKSVSQKVSRNRFATQIYNRLTNSNPELVLVFMRAGQSHRMPKYQSASNDREITAASDVKMIRIASARSVVEPPSVQVQGEQFGGSFRTGSSSEIANDISIHAKMRKRRAPVEISAGNSRSNTTASGTKIEAGSDITRRQSSGKNHFDNNDMRREQDRNEKSKFHSLVDAIERVTGLDLDGDGTVAGDIICQDDDFDIPGLGKVGGKTRFSQSAWGLEIWELINISMAFLYDPELQSQKLTVFAARFFTYGCRASHLKILGDSIQGVFGESLALNGVSTWGKSESGAWKWFWDRVDSSLRLAFNAREKDFADIICAGWTTIRAENTDDMFGDIFFTEMQRRAPDLVCLFIRPKSLQHSTFISLIETIIQFVIEPEEFYNQVKPLSIRHIKYGVKAEYVKCFGTVLINVLKNLLGNRFTDESQAAWTYAWNGVSRCIAECLNIGSNLITVALVAGDVEELERALSFAPRGQRADWTTRVQIHDSVVSPLYWAIKDGMVDMARIMIQDLLALRADRLAYYYGRDNLWSVHPDVVSVLCSLCPDLLEDLLDGMLWHSSSVEYGRVRVNYYVRELYGNPDLFHDAWESPFAVLALEGPTSLFVHPAVEKVLLLQVYLLTVRESDLSNKQVLDIKWSLFARNRFLAMEFWYTFILVLYEAAFVFLDGNDCLLVSLRQGVGVLAIITISVQLVLLARQLQTGHIGNVRLARLISIPLPRWLHSRWNSLRFISMLILVITTFNDGCHRSQITFDSSLNTTSWTNLPVGSKYPTAVASLFLWTGTLQAGTMVSDVSRVLAVLVIILMAFSTALACVGTDQAIFENFGTALQSLSRLMLNLDPPIFDFSSQSATVFLICFIIISIIGVLNILIAQLNKTYAGLSNLTQGYAALHRARIAVEIESYMPLRQRKQIWNSLNFDDPLEFESGYKGPAGGIQVLEPASVLQHNKYKPDRVLHYQGDASPLLPWPDHTKINKGVD